MMNIFKNFSLKRFNSFSIEAKANLFGEIKKEEDLDFLNKEVDFKKTPYLIIGEGSNLLFVENFNGIILKMALKGKKVIQEDDRSVFIEAKAGENWHNFVDWTIKKGYGGLENLSFIPGNIGAAPIQNIGAYGVELKDSLVWLDAYEIHRHRIKRFSNEECKLAYRDSIFKNEHKDKYIILSVCFKLQKKEHRLITSYEEIEKQLYEMKEKPTIQSISQAVIHIRKKKLPDPKKLANAGSFFKNPIIEKSLYEDLKCTYKDMKGFSLMDDKMKISAGWLIEKIGWKGKKEGSVGVYPYQALVLVNYGEASGREIYSFAEKIKEEVKKKFSIILESEVRLIM